MASDEPLRPVAQRMRVWEWGILLAILGLASFLRFQEPGTVEYRKDEANLSRLALSMARGESVPLLGIGSSIGAPNPPFSVWVFVPPYLFGNDPILATQWVGLLNVLAVLLLFLFARRWFGLATAIVAASLFATNPWAVIWSRKIWAQDVIPFFVLLTFGTGVLGFLECKRLCQALFLPLLSITGQIYYATFVLIPAALYLIWAGRKHLGRPFWIGVGLTVLSVVPFAVGAIQAWQALPPGVAAEHLAKESEARHVALSANVLLRLRDAWGGSGAKAFVGGEVSDLVLDGAPDGEVVYEVIGWLALLACAWLVVRALKKGATSLDRVLALWFVVTLCVYAFTWTTIWIHYMIPAFPVGFLALGMVASRVRARWMLTIGAVLLVALCGVHVWSQTSTLKFVGTYATPGGFGVPLGMRLTVRDDILSREPERVLIFREDGHAPLHEDAEASIWDVLLRPQKEMLFLGGASWVSPQDDHILVSRSDLRCWGDGTIHKLRPRVNGPRDGMEFGTCFQVNVLEPGSSHHAQEISVQAGASACGLRLQRYYWVAEDEACCLVWRADHAYRGADGGLYVSLRLLDGTGDELSTLDVPLPEVRTWHAGDDIYAFPEPGNSGRKAVSIEVRLFVKRPGIEERHWIGLKDDPDTNHVTLKLR